MSEIKQNLISELNVMNSIDKIIKDANKYGPFIKGMQNYLKSQDNITNYIQYTINNYRDMIAKDSSSCSLAGSNLSKLINELAQPTTLGIKEQAARSFYNISSEYFNFANLIGKQSNYINLWIEHINKIRSNIDSYTSNQKSIASYLSRISEISSLSMAALSSTSWIGIGENLRLESQDRNLLQCSIIELTGTYSNYYKSLEGRLADLAILPPIVFDYPPIELYNATKLITSISKPDIHFNKINQLENIDEELSLDIEELLPTLLADLDNKLIKLWQGAKAALSSKNPDKARHFAISLRELFSHVIHYLSPEDKIKDWNSDPNLFVNGKPTRKTRLLYICRHVNNGPFEKFVQKDIDALLEFLNLFQKGTHSIDEDYNEEQLSVMLMRMESALRFLLGIWKETK